jgi:hypothetical protein
MAPATATMPAAPTMLGGEALAGDVASAAARTATMTHLPDVPTVWPWTRQPGPSMARSDAPTELLLIANGRTR